MSCHFIAGKPGGGKTLYSVRIIVDELVRGHRPIVTNVALKLDMLNAYLQERYPRQYREKFEYSFESIPPDRVLEIKESVGDGVRVAGPVRSEAGLRHITEQINLIDEDQMKDFFCYRGDGVKLVSVSNAEWKAGKRPDFSPVADSGVLYVLDEVQNVFNARAWASTGAQVLYYLSQHRKLGDDVVCITQAVHNVDKQFRSIAQDFTYIRNLAKGKHGVFRLPSLFIRQTYSQPATGNVTASETGTFRLDVSGLASLYDTAKGVGIIGRSGADVRERRRGVHWLFLALGVPLIVWLGLSWFPRAFAGWTSHGVNQATVALQHKISGDVGVGVKIPAAVPVVQVVTEQVAPVVSLVPPAPLVLPSVEDEVWCSGYYSDSAGVFKVILSEGEVISTRSGRITLLTSKYVIVDGHRYRVLSKPPKAAPAVPESLPAHVPAVTEPIYIPVVIPAGGAQ
jgi:hypothetical protein